MPKYTVTIHRAETVDYSDYYYEVEAASKEEAITLVMAWDREPDKRYEWYGGTETLDAHAEEVFE